MSSAHGYVHDETPDGVDECRLILLAGAGAMLTEEHQA